VASTAEVGQGEVGEQAQCEQRTEGLAVAEAGGNRHAGKPAAERSHDGLPWTPGRRRGRAWPTAPVFTSRRTLHTGADLLTDKQRARLTALFAAEEHIEVEATWGIYQRMITAYREPDREQARNLMTKLIDSVSHAVPAALTEVRKLGRTLKHRAADVLAYFDRPGTSNGPTEAICA
jgi:hypothetical protein